jgi:hypothetical protein
MQKNSDNVCARERKRYSTAKKSVALPTQSNRYIACFAMRKRSILITNLSELTRKYNIGMQNGKRCGRF